MNAERAADKLPHKGYLTKINKLVKSDKQQTLGDAVHEELQRINIDIKGALKLLNAVLASSQVQNSNEEIKAGVFRGF